MQLWPLPIKKSKLRSLPIESSVLTGFIGIEKRDDGRSIYMHDRRQEQGAVMAYKPMTVKRTRGTLQPKDCEAMIDCPECNCWHVKGGCGFVDVARIAVDKARGSSP